MEAIIKEHLNKTPYLKPVSYLTEDGTEISTNLLIMPASIVSISDNKLAVKNGKGTEYRIATVVYKHPTRGVISGQAQVWEASLESNPTAFGAEALVDLAVQTEGDYVGRAKVQLPGATPIDIAETLKALQGVKGEKVSQEV